MPQTWTIQLDISDGVNLGDPIPPENIVWSPNKPNSGNPVKKGDIIDVNSHYVDLKFGLLAEYGFFNNFNLNVAAVPAADYNAVNTRSFWVDRRKNLLVNMGKTIISSGELDFPGLPQPPVPGNYPQGSRINYFVVENCIQRRVSALVNGDAIPPKPESPYAPVEILFLYYWQFKYQPDPGAASDWELAFCFSTLAARV